MTEDRVPDVNSTGPENDQPNGAPNGGMGGATQRRRDLMMSAAELRMKTFEPVRYVLPGLIPEGVTLLVARPKAGKSWFALDLSVGALPIAPLSGD